MIRSACMDAGWSVQTMSFTDLWSSGFCHCSGIRTIGWVNTEQIGTTFWEQGQLPMAQARIRLSQTTGISDLNNLLARGASWTAKKNYPESTGRLCSSVNSPQSESLYGVREQNESVSIQADFDAFSVGRRELV